MSRESMIIYASFYEAAQEMDAQDRIEFYDALMYYGIYGEMPEVRSAFARSVLKAIKPQIDANTERYNNSRKGGRPSKPMVSETVENKKPMVSENDETLKPMVSENVENKKPNVYVYDNVNDNVNVNVNENVKGIVKGKTKFSPPTPADVKNYCEEKKITNVDPEHFCDYYQAQGWKLSNGNVMKDWRSAVNNWARSERKTATVAKPPNKYDMGEHKATSSADIADMQRFLRGLG